VTFKEKIKQTAWKIGLLEAKDRPVPKALYTELDAAIRAHPSYEHAGDTAINDGVGREWGLK
jgi:hypothetical protein